VPLETVSVVQNPMVLIWEDNQAAWDTSPNVMGTARLALREKVLGSGKERTVAKPGRRRYHQSLGDDSPCFHGWSTEGWTICERNSMG
jgi:hypothetical protein